MAHTPEPWEYGVRKDKSVWLSLGNPTTGPHFQGDLYASEADARLVCAAPLMLRALKEAQVEIDADAAPDTYHLITAAIAKATRV